MYRYAKQRIARFNPKNCGVTNCHASRWGHLSTAFFPASCKTLKTLVVPRNQHSGFNKPDSKPENSARWSCVQNSFSSFLLFDVTFVHTNPRGNICLLAALHIAAHLFRHDVQHVSSDNAVPVQRPSSSVYYCVHFGGSDKALSHGFQVLR